LSSCNQLRKTNHCSFAVGRWNQPKANGKILGNFIEKTARKVMYFVYLCSVNSGKDEEKRIDKEIKQLWLFP